MNNCIEIIVGRPSSGKTLLGAHLCRNYAIEGKNALYFSIELSANVLKEKYGISDDVVIVDTPDLDWGAIERVIDQKKPALCVVDYLQLLEGYNYDTLNQIIQGFDAVKKETKLIILAQSTSAVGEDQNYPTHKDILRSDIKNNPREVKISAIGKNSYMIPGEA